MNERYELDFYGIPLPQTGARILIVADRSSSMDIRDVGRDDGGTRWTTLIDEISRMTLAMETLIAAERVPFSIVLLYEGGGDHEGTKCFNLIQKGERDALLHEVKSQSPGEGGNMKVTFGKHLWPLVAKHHITHIFFLGDTDIDRQAGFVKRAVEAWYALPEIKKQQRSTFHTMSPSVFETNDTELMALKQQWWKLWGERIRLKTFNRGIPIPPPQPNVIFNCITIGRKSKTQQALAVIGGGQCIQVSIKKKKRQAPPTP